MNNNESITFKKAEYTVEIANYKISKRLNTRWKCAMTNFQRSWLYAFAGEYGAYVFAWRDKMLVVNN